MHGTDSPLHVLAFQVSKQLTLGSHRHALLISDWDTFTMWHGGASRSGALPGRRFDCSPQRQAGKVLWLLCRRQRPVYLLNYAVYKPPDSWKATHKSFLDNSISCGVRPSWHQLVHHRSCRGRGMPPCTMLMRQATLPRPLNLPCQTKGMLRSVCSDHLCPCAGLHRGEHGLPD